MPIVPKHQVHGNLLELHQETNKQGEKGSEVV